MFKINYSVLDFFISKNKISACRLYFYVKEKFNNHLHLSDFKQIQTDLKISRQTILINLRQLEALNVCTKKSKTYFRFHSWKKFAPANKSRIKLITLQELKNIKFLRTLWYGLKYTSSYFCSKKNSQPKKSSRIGDAPVKSRKSQTSRTAFHPVSASFVQAVTSIDRSENTILKHLHRYKFFGHIEIKTNKQSFYITSTLDYALQYMKYNKPNPNCFISKVGSMYEVVSFLPNLVRPVK